jgi:hypothetical protein
MVTMTIARAREIALKMRCDPRSVLRAWREPGCIRGMLGEALEIELAPLRAACATSDSSTLRSEAPGHGRLQSA